MFDLKVFRKNASGFYFWKCKTFYIDQYLTKFNKIVQINFFKFEFFCWNRNFIVFSLLKYLYSDGRLYLNFLGNYLFFLLSFNKHMFPAQQIPFLHSDM